MAKLALSVNNVSKAFKLPHEKQSSIKGLFVNLFRGKRTFERQQVLHDVSFEIKKGEFFGIVGRNGSGKSTLLKLLAGIYAPDKGVIHIHGKLTPFIELGVGFNPELTGKENVYLNGALLGFNRKEMAVMYDDIVAFAEIERFMDQKLKNYSSGMQVRLAFSIAIRAKTDILLIDEVLAVGDAAFQRKCFNYFKEVKKRGATVVFVSHDTAAVKEFCDRALLLEQGSIVLLGKPDMVCDEYNAVNLRTIEEELAKDNRASRTSRKLGDGSAEITAVTTWGQSGSEQNTFMPSEKITVKIDIKARRDISAPTVGMTFQDQAGTTVFATNTPYKNKKLKNVKKDQEFSVYFEVDNIFTNGKYSIASAVADSRRQKIYYRKEKLHYFELGGWEMAHSIVHPEHTVRVTYQ